jgi:hypothetical protein
MNKQFKKLLWKAALYLGVPAALAAGGYSWWAKSRLDSTLAAGGVKEYSIASLSLADAKDSKAATSQSRVLRVAVKRKGGVNWRPSPHGLVYGLYDWPLGGGAWVEVPPTPDEATASLKLHRLEIETPGYLIDELSSKDPYTREAASTLLVLRTGQDFGYRHDRPPESQKDAIAKWKTWWEANKVTWSAQQVLEKTKEVLGK